ncbi:MAG: hypothetical protein ACI89T_002559 [Cognaticolwellia sp.]|jgi:hypothetical protein
MEGDGECKQHPGKRLRSEAFQHNYSAHISYI